MTEVVTVCNTHCNTCGTSRCRLIEAKTVQPRVEYPESKRKAA